VSNINSTVSVDNGKILQGAGKIKLDGIDLGSFRDGVTLTYNETHSFTRSDYGLGEIDGEVMESTCEVNTTLEQATVTNMCIAMGGNTSSSSSSSSSISWDFGPEMAVRTMALVLTGMSAMDKTKGRRFTFFRVLRVGSTAHTLKRGSESLLPVTFKCMQNSASKYFRLEEPIPLASI